jgi:hypothetical protein
MQLLLILQSINQIFQDYVSYNLFAANTYVNAAVVRVMSIYHCGRVTPKFGQALISRYEFKQEYF